MARYAQADLSFDSVIRGHHVYKRVWEPFIGETLQVSREEDNIHDRWAVSVVLNGNIVGHVPREISRPFWHFLLHDGEISCEVTGPRRYGNGLEVPCKYRCAGRRKLITKLKLLLL